jgi:pantetheine-phosphate adenylyltransferase
MYKHAVIGGTFDGLHKGHQYILTRAFESARTVTIGLTSEAYIRRFKKSRGVTPYSKRYQELTKWLRSQHFAERTIIVPLDNAWGPAVIGDFEAIIVSRDNKHVAREINGLRRERGLPDLVLVEITIIDADDQEPISSTRVRAEEIDREGHLRLPDSLRPELQKPLGRVLVGVDAALSLELHKKDPVITVGDVTTKTVLAFGIKPTLAVIDLQVERKPYQTLDAFQFSDEYTVVHVESGPGFISRDALYAIKRWGAFLKTRKHTLLVVSGEEDLLTLPVLAEAPIGSVLYYGNPPSTGLEGLVEVIITKKIKSQVKMYIDKFLRTEDTRVSATIDQ